MAILKFKVFLEEDDAIYRNIEIKHTQLFSDLSEAILSAFNFDNKFEATFYRTNEKRQRGREISKEVYDNHEYVVAPLMMSETKMGSEVRIPDQKFIFVYDFNKNWVFGVDLIGISKTENPVIVYPYLVRSEGLAPQQYGTKSLLGDKFVDIEEKYDLKSLDDGFDTQDPDGGSASDEETEASDSDDFSEEDF